MGAKRVELNKETIEAYDIHKQKDKVEKKVKKIKQEIDKKAEKDKNVNLEKIEKQHNEQRLKDTILLVSLEGIELVQKYIEAEPDNVSNCFYSDV